MRLNKGLACLILTASAAAAEAPAPPVQWATALVGTQIDHRLLNERVVCASGGFHAAVQRFRVAHPERADAAPEVVPHCLAVLEETAQRDLAMDLFWRLTVQDELYSDRTIGAVQSGEMRQILNAAQTDAVSYESSLGDIRPLPCPLAFDAGYQYGVARPNPAVDGITETGARAWIRACFAENSTLSRKAGLMAGIWAGQRQN